MIKVSVFYPNGEGSTFDMAYYCKKHIPMVQKLLGAALKGVAVEEGLGGMLPGSPPAYLALGHLIFESLDTFQTAWAPHAPQIVADVPNYTNIQPALQISAVRIGEASLVQLPNPTPRVTKKKTSAKRRKHQARGARRR